MLLREMVEEKLSCRNGSAHTATAGYGLHRKRHKGWATSCSEEALHSQRQD